MSGKANGNETEKRFPPPHIGLLHNLALSLLLRGCMQFQQCLPLVVVAFVLDCTKHVVVHSRVQKDP